MLTTDYELVFPQCGDVEGYYATTPGGMVCDGECVSILAQDINMADRDYYTVLDDLNSYMECVENQDDGTLKELRTRSAEYRDKLVVTIAEVLVSAVSVARAHDITDMEVQRGVDRYVGLAS